MTVSAFPTPPSRQRIPPRPATPDSVDSRAPSYRHSRVSTNSSFFSHESHGPQTPRADGGLSLVICSDNQDYHSRDKKPDSWWADLTPRIPQLDPHDGDVCVDDSPTLPDISISLLRHFPRPPGAPSSSQHPYAHASSSKKSESTETLHAEPRPLRKFTPPPRSTPPERPLPLDPEKLAEVNRALRELGLQQLASASVLTPATSPRNSTGSQARPSTSSSSGYPPATPATASDTASIKSSRSSKSSRSVNSIAPSIPSRSSSRRTPKIASRASSLKLIRSPYGVPTESIPFPRSSSAPFGISRYTPSPDFYPASLLGSPISAKSLLRTPRSSYRNSSIRSIRSAKLPSIYETPRDLDLVPSGDWALRDRSPYRLYGASKSQPDLSRGDMAIHKVKHRKYQGGSPPLDGTSFTQLGSSSLWRASPLETDLGVPWEERLSLLKNRLLISAGDLTPSGARVDDAGDFFSPLADSPPQLDYHEPEQREESLLDDVRAMVEAKGWAWPEPPVVPMEEGEDYQGEEDPTIGIAVPMEPAPERTSSPPPSTSFPPPAAPTEEPVTPAQTHSSTLSSSPVPPTPSTRSTKRFVRPPTAPVDIFEEMETADQVAIASYSQANAAPPATLPKEPVTPAQTNCSTLDSLSMPHTPSSLRSSTRSSRAPVAAMDLSLEIDAIDQAEAERIAALEKEEAIANGTYVDLSAPRIKSIGFAGPSTPSLVESAPSIHKAKMKKEGATPPSESKGLKFIKSFRKSKG